MKIAPIPAPTNAQPAAQMNGQVDHPFKIKMNVNQTPEWRKPEAQAQDMPGAVRPPISAENSDQAEQAEERQPISPQFAALRKAQRALQVKERELQEKERALQQGTGQSNAVPIDRVKTDPLGVLMDAGVTYEQLTEAILANQGKHEYHALQREIKELREGMDKKLSDREVEQEKQVMAEMQREAFFLSKQGDDFELIRESRSVPDVMKLIDKTYRTTGEVLDVREAMQLVESELLKDLQKLNGAKKLQGQLVQQQPGQPHMQQHRGMRTLTNQDTATVPMSAKARAIAAFYGTLKQ